MLSITIDEKSISTAAAGQLDLDQICANLGLPSSDAITKCVRVGEHGFVISRSFQPRDTLLTIWLGLNGPLTDLTTGAREEALGRIFRCTTMLVTGRTRSIPVTWRAFHSRNRLSFQADRYLRSADGGRTNAGRIVLELIQDDGQRVWLLVKSSG